MQRLVVSQPSAVRFALESDTGVLVDADTPPVVTIFASNGDVAATGSTVVDGGTGLYKFPWTAPALGVYNAVFSGVIDSQAFFASEGVRAVSRRATPIRTIKADPELAELDDRDFLAAVAGAEEAMENALRYRIVETADTFGFRVLRARRDLLLPSGSPWYTSAVLALSRGTETLDPATVSVQNGILRLPTFGNWDFLTGAPTGTWIPGDYSISLQHGLPETPGDIQKAIRILARHMNPLREDTHPDRAKRITTAETDIWFSRGGAAGSWFGIPEVDDIVEANQARGIVATADLNVIPL